MMMIAWEKVKEIEEEINSCSLFAGLPYQAADVHHEGGCGLYGPGDGCGHHEIQCQPEEEQMRGYWWELINKFIQFSES